MLISAIEDFSLNHEKCYVIGDRINDIIAGDLANIKNLYLLKKSYSYKGCSKKQLPNFKTISSVKEIPDTIRRKYDENFC